MSQIFRHGGLGLSLSGDARMSGFYAPAVAGLFPPDPGVDEIAFRWFSSHENLKAC